VDYDPGPDSWASFYVCFKPQTLLEEGQISEQLLDDIADWVAALPKKG
jgi:hypothetical protein